MFECFKSKPGAVHQPSSREAVSFGSEKVLEKKSEVAIAQTEIREMKDEWTHSAIKSQISMRRHRRNEANLLQIFNDFKDPSVGALRKQNLITACEAAGMDNADDEGAINDVLYKLNVKSEDALCFEEFRGLIEEPSELESVMKDIPFHQVFADAVPRNAGVTPIKVFTELTPIEIDMIVQAAMESLKELLVDQSSKLKRVQHRLVQDAEKFKAGNSKFSCSMMSSGQISDFHEGLGSRVGNKNSRVCSTAVHSVV